MYMYSTVQTFVLVRCFKCRKLILNPKLDHKMFKSVATPGFLVGDFVVQLILKGGIHNYFSIVNSLYTWEGVLIK